VLSGALPRLKHAGLTDEQGIKHAGRSRLGTPTADDSTAKHPGQTNHLFRASRRRRSWSPLSDFSLSRLARRSSTGSSTNTDSRYRPFIVGG
jgi:hypothetical protein